MAKLENEITAIKFVEEKYAKQDQENQELKKKIESKNYTTAEFSEYHNMYLIREKDFLKVMQSMLIDSLNGKKLETLEEKMEAVDEIPLNMWTVYNNTLKSKFDFGVNSEVEFGVLCNSQTHYSEVSISRDLFYTDHGQFRRFRI